MKIKVGDTASVTKTFTQENVEKFLKNHP